MKPDPNTEEGRAEIRRILERRKQLDSDARRRSEESPDEEPFGKLTAPSELDLRRDRKNKDD